MTLHHERPVDKINYQPGLVRWARLYQAHSGALVARMGTFWATWP
jgi:hypothetical protein